MDNSNRYLASLERISSSVKIPKPNIFRQDARTGHSGYFASSSRGWDSSSFPPTAVAQTQADFEGDEDVPLDDFGKLKLRLHSYHRANTSFQTRNYWQLRVSVL
jgi:hypothetical protein